MARSLFRWIFLGCVVVAVLPLLGGLLASRWMMREAVGREVRDRVAAVGQQKLAALQDFLEEREQDAVVLGRAPVLVQAAREIGQARAPRAPRGGAASATAAAGRARDHLRAFATGGGYGEAFLIAPDGEVLAAALRTNLAGENVLTGPLKLSPLAAAYRECRRTGKPVFSEMGIPGPAQSPAIFVVSPVREGSTNVAFAASWVRSEAVHEVLRGEAGLGDSGELVVAARAGHRLVLIAPLRNAPRPLFSDLGPAEARFPSALQAAAAGRDGGGFLKDHRGEECVGWWKQVPRVGWAFVAKQDAREALSTRVRWGWREGLLLGGALVLAAVVAGFVARRFTKAITRLQAALQRATAGDWGHRLEWRDREDEFGELSRSVDDLLERLQVNAVPRPDFDREVEGRRKAEEELKRCRDGSG